MAFFKERGFSGTRSNTQTRFSGEPLSLSTAFSGQYAAFSRQLSGSRISLRARSLSTDQLSNVRAIRISKTVGNRLLRVGEIARTPDFYGIDGMFIIFELHSGRVQAPMIRRTVLNFLQCFLVAMFTKLQFLSSVFVRIAASVRRSAVSSIYTARLLDEKSTRSGRPGV